MQSEKVEMAEEQARKAYVAATGSSEPAWKDAPPEVRRNFMAGFAHLARNGGFAPY